MGAIIGMIAFLLFEKNKDIYSYLGYTIGGAIVALCVHIKNPDFLIKGEKHETEKKEGKGKVIKPSVNLIEEQFLNDFDVNAAKVWIKSECTLLEHIKVSYHSCVPDQGACYFVIEGIDRNNMRIKELSAVYKIDGAYGWGKSRRID